MSLENIAIRLSLMVNPSDLDEYGHLNNSKFSYYFEKARVKLQEKAGYSTKNLIKLGVGLFVYESNYKYKKQVFGNEKIFIESKFRSYNGGLKIQMDHFMSSKSDLLATLNQTLVFYDLKKEKLILKPPEWFVKSIYKR